MKTFEQVQRELGEDFADCLVNTSEFLDWWDNGSVSSYDGVGDLHDGNSFVTNGFKTNIFEYICSVAHDMTKEEFIQKYPYVAWYNN